MVLRGLDKVWEGMGVGELCVDGKLGKGDWIKGGKGKGELCMDSRFC